MEGDQRRQLAVLACLVVLQRKTKEDTKNICEILAEDKLEK